MSLETYVLSKGAWLYLGYIVDCAANWEMGATSRRLHFFRAELNKKGIVFWECCFCCVRFAWLGVLPVRDISVPSVFMPDEPKVCGLL